MFVITGGGSGIGSALALSLVQRGKSVLIVGRRESNLQQIAAYSSAIEYVCADITTEAGLAAVSEYCQSSNQIEALINNAGTIEPIAAIKDVNAKQWQQAIDTNVSAVLFLTQALYAKLAQGRVLNISSGVAHFPLKGWGAYCVTKAALSMLTRCFQEEAQDVFFASVMPGIVDTAMQGIARSDVNIDKQQMAFYQKLKQENRLLSAETVAAFLTWLLLDVDKDSFKAQEWDIYAKEHHKEWLLPPHQVPAWDD